MKINVDNIKMMPLHIGNNFCVYGPISDEINEWCKFHGISIQPSGKFTNLILPKDISAEDLFIHPSKYEYLDGFSPNLNKHLHLGHLSNLVLAKSFQSLGIAEKSIAILGDTLVGEVTKEEALSKLSDRFYRVDTSRDRQYGGAKLCDTRDEKRRSRYHTHGPKL